MARHLYRFYLYIVFIALLIYAAIAIGLLLNTLLVLTPLRTYETVPASSEIIQSTIFTIVSLLIAGALASLHYWLIRRDIRNDPAAGESAIRALFLNLTEAIGVAIVVPLFGYGALLQSGVSSASGLVVSIAVALPTLILVVLLELERRRTQAAPGIAMTFQRFHFYGIQLLLLMFFAISWFLAFTQLVDVLFFTGTGKIAAEICGQGNSICHSYHPLFLSLNLLWFLGFWVLYGWVTRNDKSPILRLIALYGTLIAGFAFILYGLFQIVQILFLDLFHLAPALVQIYGSNNSNNFIAPLSLGVIVIALADYWLRRATRIGIIEPKGLRSIESAFLAILAGGVFWWGCGDSLYRLLETLFSSVAFNGQSWAIALALIVAGIGYIPFDLFLWRQNNQKRESAASPRRGLVLALLGGGILSFAIGGAIALYAWITALFHSPIANWQQTAHAGLAAFLIGAILIIVYLRTARREHLFTTITRHTPEPIIPTPVGQEQPTTIEQLVDELLTGKITRDKAILQLHQLVLEPQLETKDVEKTAPLNKIEQA